MSLSFGSHNTGSEMDQEVEVNIASIVDCFTVLITYLLAAASFVSIGALGAGMAQSGSTDSLITSPLQKNQVFVTLEMTESHALLLKTTGADTRTYSFPAEKGEYDFAGAIMALQELHEKFPNLDSFTLVPESAVEYLDIIAAISKTKKALPVFFVKTESL